MIPESTSAATPGEHPDGAEVVPSAPNPDPVAPLPQPAGAGPLQPPWKIALLSGMVLALELALIRQVPAEVRVISYFTNLMLMASFFGFGLGCLMEKRRSTIVLFPLGLLCVWGFIYYARGLVIYEELAEVVYWLQYGPTAQQARPIPLLVAAVSAFVLAATPFVPLGQQLAQRMAEHPRLTAYGWDIGGSLAGVGVFTVAAYLGIPPWVWPPVLAGTWAVALRPARWAGAAAGAAGLLFLTFAFTPLHARWSPYYFVQYEQQADGICVWVNSSFHQFAVNFRGEDPQTRQLAERMLEKFSTPYRHYRENHGGRGPRRVLVLGAGTGNDVHVALSQGAERVVAVEIDPVILDLGRRQNRARPYDDPRVTTVLTDARRYLRTSDETFDLVLLATLDSQTLLSGHANLRLENYVYTVESFRDIRARLAPDGMLGAYYWVTHAWVVNRIFSTLAEAFEGRVNVGVWGEDRTLFNALFLASTDPGVVALAPDQIKAYWNAVPSTDDWPFLYVEAPTIAPIYRKLALAILLLIAGVAAMVRRWYPGTGLHADFFLLGLGFTLLESAAVVRMALLFGSTWVVNSLVFASVLATVFLANRGVVLGWAPSLRWAWPGVIAGLVVNWLMPVGALLALPEIAQSLAVALLIGGPVFCAAICFSRLFREAPDVGGAFGMNLIGAMTGGLLEYLSMLLGMSGVWLLAVAIYGGAWLAFRARQK